MNARRSSAGASPTKQQATGRGMSRHPAALCVTADAAPEGLQHHMTAGQMVRVETGSELKSLILWSLERSQEGTSSVVTLVIRDGHTMKKKVSWRPTATDSSTLTASGIAFVPAHAGASTHANSTLWTTWSDALTRKNHQVILFDPVSRQPLRGIPFLDLFSGLPPAQALYTPADSAELQRGVRFSTDCGAGVQEPLITFSSSSHRILLVHQFDLKGVVGTAVSCILPRHPFTVTDTCRLPSPFGKEKSSRVSRIELDSTGTILYVVSERLHCAVISSQNASRRLQIIRQFRPRDFLTLATSPKEAVAVSAEWVRAEIEQRVILPEYFVDPFSLNAISEPRRFGPLAGQQKSSAASQRSSSQASTVPQRVSDAHDAVRPSLPRHNFEARDSSFVQASSIAPSFETATEVKDGGASIPPPHPTSAFVAKVSQLPSLKIVVKAVEALAALQSSLVLSRYFTMWSTKAAKNPSLCIDGWGKGTSRNILVLPLDAVAESNQAALTPFLRVCHEASVELWLIYTEGESDPARHLLHLRLLDTHRVVGQLICAPPVSKYDRKVYFRHLSCDAVLLLLPSVAWMTRVQFMGIGASETAFAECPHRLYCQPDHNKSWRSVLQKVAQLVFCCRRASKSRAAYIWEALVFEEVRGMLTTVKECSADGKRFVDLPTLDGCAPL